MNKGNHSLKQCIKLENFPYVKDFIDGLISYRIEKKSMHISNEELKKLTSFSIIEDYPKEKQKRDSEAVKEFTKTKLFRDLNKRLK